MPGVGGSRDDPGGDLRDHWDEAMLYRDLARLRTAEDGVPIRQRDPDELRWDGAPRDEWEAFCEEWGLDRLGRGPIAGSRGLTAGATAPRAKRRLPDERQQRPVVRRRSGQDADRLGLRAKSNHGPPSIAVTSRPPARR